MPETQPADPTMNVSTSQLADAIVSAVRETQPPRKITFAERKARSPFNPSGNKKRVLSRVMYQNGTRLMVNRLHDEEISLLNQLKPGKFVNGLVTVVEKDKGAEQEIHIFYKSALPDDRMALKGEVKDFKEMLRRCVSEAKAPK